MSTESYPPSGLSASVQKLPEWIQKGCGDSEYICEEKGATFSADSPPADCPDLSKHNSFFSESMNADIWNKLKDKKTKLGVTLAHCIKTGVDNPGNFVTNLPLSPLKTLCTPNWVIFTLKSNSFFKVIQ